MNAKNIRAHLAAREHADVRLTYQESLEDWTVVRLAWHRLNPGEERQEVAALLRRRGAVLRLRQQPLTASEVYHVLSALPRAETSAVELQGRAVKKGDQQAPRVILTVPGRMVVLARSPVVAAVVAAARTTRRPLRALTALATRLLIEGRVIVRPHDETKD